MGTRRQFIERIRRQIYGEMPTDDAAITVNLVNNILNDAIAIAAKTNYTEAIRMGEVGYVNNSFYTKFKNLSVTKSENFLWQVQLPEIPLGLGKNEGVALLKFVDSTGNKTLPCIPLSQNQVGYVENIKKPINKTLYYTEGSSIFILTTVALNTYTAQVTMGSGGDSTNLDSELNVPEDYYQVMSDYILKQLAFEQSRVRDTTEDGFDNGDRQ